MHLRAGLPDKEVLKRKLILSKHYYDRTPSESELRCLLEVMQHCKPAVAKIATTAQDITDALRMLELPRRSESCRLLPTPSGWFDICGCLQCPDTASRAALPPPVHAATLMCSLATQVSLAIHACRLTGHNHY